MKVLSGRTMDHLDHNKTAAEIMIGNEAGFNAPEKVFGRRFSYR